MSGKAFVYSVIVSVSASILTYKIIKSLNGAAKDVPRKRENVADLIGNTPMVRIKSLSEATGCEIYAKLELANPGGSAKDRVALSVIRHFEEIGELVPGRGDVLFEGTSGSTGISFAMLCNSLGYTAHICLPDDTSLEKLQLLDSYGAEIEKVKPASIVDPNQYVNAARKGALALRNDKSTQANGVFADQFENDNNWRVHYNTTGPEIWEQMDHNIDYFITGSGTGGTIAGCSKFLKSVSRKVKIFLADPQGSGMFNRVKYGVMYNTVEKEGTRRRHQVDTIIEGVGLNRITHNFLQGEHCVDDAIRVTDEQAVRMARFLSSNDGLFVGSSSSINAVAAVKVAKNAAPGSRIVIIACDSGSRHLSKFWKEALKVDKNLTLEDVLNV
ncbi:putative cysteine synthase [Pichia kudriavzevii]|uniref:cysteine synthase n=1 Tax=Pichia kudriavzevii TaxID=4909 RepID=A0A1V2LL80_PICKU|nr:putative cysteine synthase [Pichia kudriavzevii]